jgi:hypothetical protein
LYITVEVSLDHMSPTQPISSAMKTPKITEDDPDKP